MEVKFPLHPCETETCFLMVADALLQIMRHLPFALLIFIFALGFSCQNVFPCKSKRHGVKDHTMSIHFTSCNSASEEKNRQMTRQLAVQSVWLLAPLQSCHYLNFLPLAPAPPHQQWALRNHLQPALFTPTPHISSLEEAPGSTV